jgi:DNA-directed RNA polymerase specialized sigma24 family protein
MGTHDLSAPGPADAVGERHRIVAALAQLPRQQRAVVVWRYYLEMSEAETAAALNISVGTVKSHSARAMARLRTLITLDDQGPDTTKPSSHQSAWHPPGAGSGGIR